MRYRDFDRMLSHHRDGFRFFAGHVFGQLEQNRTRPLLHCDTKRVAHQGRDAACADDLKRELRQRLECPNDVDDLELCLTAAHDALLSRQHDHGHSAKQGVSRSPSSGSAHPDRAW